MIFDQEKIESALEKWKNFLEKEKENAPLISFEKLWELFSAEEKKELEKFLSLDPKSFGFWGKFWGKEESGNKKLICFQEEYRSLDGKRKKIDPCFMPEETYKALGDLKAEMKKSIGKTILVESAYRSPAYQLMTFLYYLRFHNWDLPKVARRVALPGYSEHGIVDSPALDFITEEGIPDDNFPEKKFEETKEYEWLSKNASKFDFTLSYPGDNQDGVIFEPWHWRYKKTS